MKIVLVHPAGSNWIPGQPDVSAIVNRMAPLGILSLAAYVARAGHAVAIYDAAGTPAPRGLATHVDAILAHAPDLVGFSATTSSFPDAAEMAAAIKQRRPQAMTVVGGVFVSSVGAGLLDRFPGIDVLVFGEGEQTLLELAEGTPPAQVRGVAYRAAGGGFATLPRPQIADLDTLPFPAYGLLDGFPRRYHLPLFQTPGSRGATMTTSRGCPYRCSYCDRSVYGRGHRVHTAGYIYEHFEHLARDFGVTHVNVYDDLFTFDRERITALCEKLIARPLGVTFNCALRVGHADEELLPLLKRAGAWMVSVGIESGDAELLKVHKAGVRLSGIHQTVAQIRDAGLKVKGLFMAGVPGETPETLQRTSDLMLELDLDDMNMTKFTPFHGAPLWATIREHGEFNEDWRLMNCNNFVFVPSGFASREELEKGYATAIKAYYTSKGYRRRLVRRMWPCRASLYIFLRNLVPMMRARRNFEPDLLPDAPPRVNAR